MKKNPIIEALERNMEILRLRQSIEEQAKLNIINEVERKKNSKKAQLIESEIEDILQFGKKYVRNVNTSLDSIKKQDRILAER